MHSEREKSLSFPPRSYLSWDEDYRMEGRLHACGIHGETLLRGRTADFESREGKEGRSARPRDL